MIELPSKYSSKGLSESDQRRVITTGRVRKNRPIGAIKIEERVNDILDHQSSTFRLKKYDNEDTDGDIPMLGMDDEEEVQVIADYVVEQRRMARPKSPTLESTDDGFLDSLSPELKPHKETIIVLDTNFMISHLDIIDKLAKLHTKYHHTIVIPTTVVRELDGLKGSTRTSNDGIDGTTVGHLARWANDWIYRKLAELDSSVRGQKLREVIDKDATKDDAILDCCLYFKEKTNSLVVLLSNDKNLCMKALANEVLTVSYRKNMTAELIAKKIFQENMSGGTHDTDEPLLDRMSQSGSPSRPSSPSKSSARLQFTTPVFSSTALTGAPSNSELSALTSLPPTHNRSRSPTRLEFTAPSSSEFKFPSAPQFGSPIFRSPSPDRIIPDSDLEAVNEIESQKSQSMHEFSFQRPNSKPVQLTQPKQDQESSSSKTTNLNIQTQNFEDAASLVFSEVQKLVLGSIDYCMQEAYGDDLEMVGYDKTNILTLKDCANTMIRFWVSVFSEYFQNNRVKPFSVRGRKEPRFIRVPYTGSELKDFVEYWDKNLRALYIKRDDRQKDALEIILKRWKHISASFV